MIFKKEIYIFIKFNNVKLNNIIISNRLKKFYIREANSIKDFAYLVGKVLDLD